MPEWRPDPENYDATKVNGLTFPKVIRSSQFAASRDIEGLDPLHVPIWKLMYQERKNNWMRSWLMGVRCICSPWAMSGPLSSLARCFSRLNLKD